MSEKNHKKYQHECCVLFLDDCFCNEDVASALTSAGFRIELFTVHFPRSDSQPTKREQGVKDPRVIALSHRKGWLILTADHHMRVRHREEFRKYPNAMVLATAHRVCDDSIWVAAVIKAKSNIERKFKKQERPWFGQINQCGEITVCGTIE